MRCASYTVAKAFQRTAVIKLEFHRTPTTLPNPFGCPGCPDWPDPDREPSFYQTYAASNHDETKYPWVIFYVNHNTINSTTSCSLTTFAVNNPVVPNAVPTDTAQRFSFVFLTDTKRQVKDLCTPAASDQELQNFVSHVVAHEYGHQRAGLTEYDGGTYTDLYHRGRVPTGRSDVMGFNTAEYKRHADPVFDAFGNELVGNRSTCRANLLTNR